MLSEYLLPETTIREAGTGPVVALGEEQNEALFLTLGITRTREQESIDLSIWGSSDGFDWGMRPLVSFSQKFYCGTYQTDLNLSAHPAIKYLRPQWQVNRWGRGEAKPLFTVSLRMEAMDRRVMALGA